MSLRVEASRTRGAVSHLKTTGLSGQRLSRQLAPGPQPQMLVGLELRHPQEIMQHVQLVALGELAQGGHLLCDEGHGLVCAALPGFLIARACRRA